MESFNRVVKGTLQPTPQVDAIETSYGNPMTPVGVKVPVEATEIAVELTWDDSGEDRICPAGRLAPDARAGGRP
jgi:hypothetical protein